MSTADDLPTALDALSLNSPSAPLSLDSKFTLVCSDGERVSVNAALLSSVSSVFRDMLETGSGEMECQVSESQSEVLLFMRLTEKEGTAVRKEDWMAMYAMYDKYDVPKLKEPLVAGTRPQVYLDPLFAFAAGLKLQDRALTNAAAAQTFSIDLKNTSSPFFFDLPAATREALRIYHNKRFKAARFFLGIVVFRKKPCICTWLTGKRPIAETGQGIWERARNAAFSRLQPSSDPVKVMRREVNTYKEAFSKCDVCRKRLLKKLDELRKRWDESWSRVREFSQAYERLPAA